ncbi:MAG: FAD-dependent oxidoreductase [Hyphomicrobium sp.]|nr:FAD-dependent oxidoreductase [Hyphomicrobium sp.]
MQRSKAESEEAGRALGHGGTINADICIIGAGSGGLSVAASTVLLGMKVVLIEKHLMGGDCLNTGCVPSKALIAAARRAHDMRTAGQFGITSVEPQVDATAVNDHIKSVIAGIARNDSVERFTGMGVEVIHAAARFRDKSTVEAGDTLVKAFRFVIATGSSPDVPAIPGLDKVPYLTNESIFDLRQPVGHLVVIGGGSVGMELAQAYLRFGAQVTVLESLKALGRDDPELSDVVLKHVRAEGLVVREGVRVERVSGWPGAVQVMITTPEGVAETVEGTHLLIAAGRRPNVQDLNLEAAGIKYDKRGIMVSSGLVTSNRRVFAIGDVIGGQQFTHVANYHAGIVFRRALFRLPAKVRSELIPWVTFTDPELAQVGLTEDQARQKHGTIQVFRWPYHENDRAQAERATEGFVKVITDRKGAILGAGIVGREAGELIQIWSLAISQGLKITAMTEWIAPYPTLGEISKRAAMGTYALTAGKPLVRKMVGLLRKLG